MNKKLHRSSNRYIAGVCGGFAEYFGIDPAIVRLALVAGTLLGGSGIIFYIIAAIVMPNE